MDGNKEVNRKKTKETTRKKRMKKRTVPYMSYVLLFLSLSVLVMLIYSQMKLQNMSETIDSMASFSQSIHQENQLLREKIIEQNENIGLLHEQLEHYHENRISKEQFTEIYMQLQELTGMVSEERKREFYLNRMVNIIQNNNHSLESEEVYQIAKNIYESSLTYKFNPFLICALIKVESNFNIQAISDAYAYGLCQVRRFIAKEIAENIGIKWDGAEKTLFNPEDNIRIGLHYLAALYDDFSDMKLALTAYNYGPFKVQEFISEEKEIPNGFSDKVFGYYSQYRGFEIEDIDEVLSQEVSVSNNPEELSE